VGAFTQPALRPLDVVVALHLALLPGDKYEEIAATLAISLSAAHRAVTRLDVSGLVLPHRRSAARGPLIEFIVHGVRYAFPAVLGPVAGGVPTAYAAPPLNEEIVFDEPVVWPSINGSVRGTSLAPLYPGAAELVNRAPKLYQALALVDALRMGRARERSRAAELVREIIREEPP